MPVFPLHGLAVCYASLLFREALGHRLKAAREVMEISDTEEVEGIDDYPLAWDFDQSWVNSTNYVQVLKDVQKRVEKMQSGSSYPGPRESTRLIRELWMLTDQKLADDKTYRCFDFCVVCEPSTEELVHELVHDRRLKSIAVTRSKGWKDQVKMALVAPLEVAGGLVGGIFDGLLAAGVIGIGGGVIAGEAMADKIGPGFLSLLTGLVSGAVSTAVVLPFATAVLPLLGAVQGIGITKALTNCGRVGFKTAEDGKFLKDQPFETHFGDSNYGLKRLRTAMGYNKSTSEQLKRSPRSNYFPSLPGDLFRWDTSPSQELQNYKAMSHCEYLRRRPFDIRHAMLCMRHSMLCGKRGGMVIPATSDDRCARQSAPFWSNPDTQIFRVFKERKERAECVVLLCAHQQKMLNGTSEPKEDLEKVNSCHRKYFPKGSHFVQAGSWPDFKEYCDYWAA
ncbi:DAPK1 [Symbiodinium sp. CCMP2592]|nr:DAPK1 [Symbiodinium sp. CCMP2592]